MMVTNILLLSDMWRCAVYLEEGCSNFLRNLCTFLPKPHDSTFKKTIGTQNIDFIKQPQIHPIFIFIVAPCILKIHWVLHTNECTNYILIY